MNHITFDNLFRDDETSLKKSSKIFNFFEYAKKLKDKPVKASNQLEPVFVPDPNYVEDPWTEEKYKRGGFEEAEKFKKEHIPSPDDNIQEDIDPLQKAVRKLADPKSKAPSNKAVALEIANQIQNEGHHGDAPSDVGVQKLTAPALYRFYKNSPHHPESLLMKYLVHRIENADKYAKATPEQALRLKQNFLALHQQGDAKSKNGHIDAQKLDQMALTKYSLISDLMTHRDHLHAVIQKHFPSKIYNVDGEPHLGLTRGLRVDKDKRKEDHALASYGHIPNTGFGDYMHHQMVPLKNVWYSFDFGPEKSSGNMGPENEFLVSPHENKYTNDADTTKSFPKKVFLEPKEMAGAAKGAPSYKMARHTENHDYMNHVINTSSPGSDEHNGLARNPAITPEIQLHLAQANYPGSLVHRALSENRSISPEIQSHLMQSNQPDSEVHTNLARNPLLTPELQMHLARTNAPDSLVHQLLSMNEQLAPEAQMHLAQANEHGLAVHSNLALNNSLTPEVQSHLINTNGAGSGVQYNLALNKKLTPEAQMHLAQTNKPGRGVHDNLSGNTSVTPEVQLHLAKVNEPESLVHRSLARISSTDEVLSHLAQTNWPGSWVHSSLSHSPSISPEIQMHLAQVNKPHSSIHEILAKHPSLSPEAQMHIAKVSDPISYPHKNLENNKNTTPEVIEHIRQAKNDHMLATHGKLGKSEELNKLVKSYGALAFLKKIF
jgi:hypothetical protein